MIELEKESTSVINDEISLNENSDDVNYAKKKFKRKHKRCDRKNIRDTLNSPKFHFFIITLVVLDCFFVAGELIIDYIEIQISKTRSELKHADSAELYFTVNQHDMDQMYENDTRISDNLSLNNGTLFHVHKNSVHKTLKVLEKICKYSSFTILSIFVVDILVKVFIEPGKFLKVLELFDAIVVFCGFFLNLYLLKSNVVIHSLSGLITVLRLALI
jgi:uncharacterized membrane protein YgdD (TMEM256/DUF423 family)